MKYVIVIFVLCASSFAQTMTPEHKAYINALNEYNAYASHHITTKQIEAKYGPMDGDRQLTACFLSAQIVIAAMKDPVLWADKNDDGEGKEWRRWTDIRHNELKCDDIK
jgi:hypothetical protein